ncbi:MAG: HAD family hydrolase [Bacillota bacterium]|nr:HAD family hydrolase [Bacillota bacterium]
MFDDVKTIFFDYDGTIHNSIKVYGPAFRKAYGYLTEKGVVTNKIWTDDEISYWLGYSVKAMWKEFMPDLDSMLRDEARKMIGDEMLRLINKGEVVLYDGALETLSYLRQKGYRLIFISNCSISYRDIARDTLGLGKYFEEMVCSQEYGYIPKYEILSMIKDKYPQKMVMIGDRFQDIEAGIRNGIHTIGCSYGFHRPDELNEADLIINDIKELMTIL